PRPPETLTTNTTTPTRAAETVEVGGKYSFLIVPHPNPRASAASGGRRLGDGWVAWVCQSAPNLAPTPLLNTF
ncbi:MAG: hypothetical protein GY869_01855, partial [Planctomycetes bacterium]|nr:hypothetical protein [Planctomycetota bacterium]